MFIKSLIKDIKICSWKTSKPQVFVHVYEDAKFEMNCFKNHHILCFRKDFIQRSLPYKYFITIYI